MSDFNLFDVTIPLVRRNPDNTLDTYDVQMRMPSTDAETADVVAGDIAWAIVTNLPKTADNNRHGWKIDEQGPTVEPVAEP